MPLPEGPVGLNIGKRGKAGIAPGGSSELAAAMLFQEAGARYLELAYNGVIYTIASGLVATPAAGPLGAAGVPLVALYNPDKSGYLVVLLRAFAAWTATGTTSGKGFELDGGNTTTTQATKQQGTANVLGASDDGDIFGYSGQALTAAAALKRLAWLSAVGNTGAQGNASQLGEDLQGAWLVPSGCIVAITAAALGVANEAIASLTYAKLKL